MQRAWWIVAIAGCYSASPASGVPCDPIAPNCPQGQMCVARAGSFVCDGEPGDIVDTLPDTASPDDLDGDGIANALDNCPMRANASQANEDADATGDVCDNCPPYPSTGADADADGVGDACDPHVLIPGDAIALFEGFAAGVPPGWITTGTWTVSGGNLRSTADDNNLATAVIPYAHTDHQTIYTHATITGLTQANGGSIGVVDRFDGTNGVVCGGGRSGDTGLLALIDAEGGMFLAQNPHPFTVNTLYRLTFERAGTEYTCSTVQASGTTTSVTDRYDKAGGPGIGFRSRVASASFPWILVVTSP